jgi:hypothetical protein
MSDIQELSVQIKRTSTHWSPWLQAHPFVSVTFEATVEISPRQRTVYVLSLSGAPTVQPRENREFRDAVKEAILNKLGLHRARIHWKES